MKRNWVLFSILIGVSAIWGIIYWLFIGPKQ
ncbi:hypothetical protein QFZ87_002114 [Bacillus sp. SLBN-46]|nr:hypothetical protein [Bacillus sp. SLBN-46]